MKKIISMALITIMAMATLSGCGASDEPSTVSTDGSTSMEEVITKITKNQKTSLNN